MKPGSYSEADMMTFKVIYLLLLSIEIHQHLFAFQIEVCGGSDLKFLKIPRMKSNQKPPHPFLGADLQSPTEYTRQNWRLETSTPVFRCGDF
jgi:hypothetical protein